MRWPITFRNGKLKPFLTFFARIKFSKCLMAKYFLTRGNFLLYNKGNAPKTTEHHQQMCKKIILYYASQDKFDVNLWRFNIYTLVCWELLRWDRKICWKGRFAICVFGSRKMLSDFLIILSRIRLSSLPTYLAM